MNRLRLMLLTMLATECNLLQDVLDKFGEALRHRDRPTTSLQACRKKDLRSCLGGTTMKAT